MVDGTVLHPQLSQGFHHSVCPERLPLLVPLKVPGTQRHLALQASLQCHRLLIYAVVAENLCPLRFSVRLPVQLRCSGLETLDDAAKFEVSLQGINTLEFLAALWATWKHFVILAGSVDGHPDAGSAVVVSTGESHRIRVELKADGAAQLISELLHWFGQRHDEK